MSAQVTPPLPESSAETTSVPPTPTLKMPSRKRFMILGALSLLLLCSLYLWGSYLTTHQPITQRLPVPQVAAEAIKPHYLFSVYNVAEPVGIAVSPDGTRIYVGERGGERMIRAFDRDGKELASFRAPGTQSGSSVPASLSLDDEGRLYVGDSLRHLIDIYDAGGNFIKTIEPPVDGGWVPVGLQVEGQTIFVAGGNKGSDGVIALSLSGQLQFRLGHHGEDAAGDGFYQPAKAVTDGGGRIYVSDGMNQRVAVFDRDRKFLYGIPGFNLPRGMAVDQDQKLYVVDTIDQLVKVYDVSGTNPKYLFEFGDQGVGDGEFNYPNDISLDGTGRLYITDRVNNRVQVWAY